MRRKVSLPLTQRFSERLSTPTVEGMRSRLGGRLDSMAAGYFPTGSLVEIAQGQGGTRLGVLLASTAQQADVLVEKGLVKRTNVEHLSLHRGEVDSELGQFARQASLFGTLVEGQNVCVEHQDGETERGVLREKCRYGALVETGRGRLLGVGFGRIWPVAACEGEN